MAARLVQRRLLDPRPAGVAAQHPVRDAVNIPFSELPNRVHELPPRQREFGVVGQEPLVREVVAWLREAGRRATAAATPALHRAADDLELGHLWEPNAFLAETLPRFSAGRALELACGTGRDAIFMSSRGWDVTAVDALPDALALASKLAGRYAPALRPIEWLERDLESGPVRFERVFDLITVVRYLHRPLFPRFRQWLRPGGSVLCETFTTRHGRDFGAVAADRPEAHVGQLAVETRAERQECHVELAGQGQRAERRSAEVDGCSGLGRVADRHVLPLPGHDARRHVVELTRGPHGDAHSRRDFDSDVGHAEVDQCAAGVVGVAPGLEGERGERFGGGHVEVGILSAVELQR